MKTFLSGLVMLVLVIGFGSCQREVDFPTEDAEVILSDNIYVTKYVELDTTFTSGLDTLLTDTLYYDSRKRLVKTIEYQYEQGVNTIIGIITSERFYNGTDSLPYKTTVKEEYTTGELYTDTTFLYYNSSKQVIKDSATKYSGALNVGRWVQLYYQNAPGRYFIKRTKLDVLVGFTSTDSLRMTRTYTAGNLVVADDSAYLEGVGLAYINRINVNYDNNKNPFLKISIPYLVQPIGAGSTGTNALQAESINNALNYTLSSLVGSTPNTSSATIRYDYNSGGYPVIMRASSSSASEKTKAFLFYRAL